MSQRAACATLALVPEDVPIDLGVIACRIKVAPYCGGIYAALQPPAGRVKGAAAWPGRTNVTEKWETVGRYKRKLPACYESAVLHNPYLGCKHNVKEVSLAWQQLQFFAIYCYLTGSPHDKGN